MHSLQFWKSWPPVYQRLLVLLAVLFIACLAIMIFSLGKNPSPVFTWQQLQELRQQELPVHSFDLGGFDLTVSADNHIIFERWLGNPMQPNLNALDVYLIFFISSLVMLFALITVLPRFWFFVTAGMAMFLISSFKLEALTIFGLENKIPAAIAMVVLLGVALYYQYINNLASLLQRVLVYLAALIALGIVVKLGSSSAQPFRYFAINTLPASIILLVVFIVMVSHEIMASFVSLVGRGSRNSRSLRHYLIISAVYLVNLWLALWSKIGWIDWDFTIQPILLLSISGVLAVWGIRQRQPLYEQIIQADPFAVYFILSLGTIAFATVGYFLGSSNDISLLSLNNLILYTHIGYGMMFLIYVASNFLGMLQKNYPVYKVMYKPTAMPYFSFRIAGLVFTLAFIFYNTLIVPVNHFISGYYTSLGDLFYAEESPTAAFGYYSRAHRYAPYNQHASTALAQLEAIRGNAVKERRFYEDANQFKPTAFTALNEANVFHQAGRKLSEILALQESNRKLPDNSIIKNTLGLAYHHFGLVDSAYKYFSVAQKNSITEGTAAMNLLGLIAENDLPVNPDSIYQLPYAKQMRAMSNALAIANRRGKMIDLPIELPKDSVLNVFSAALIGNFITNHRTKTDTAFLSTCIHIGQNPKNQVFKEVILVPAANACYATGQVNRAYQLLQQSIIGSSHPGIHNTTLALWSLEQDKPNVGLQYLQYAMDQKAEQASFANAIALAENGRINEAIIAWDTLGHRKDSIIKSTSESMKRLLAAPVSLFVDLSEKEKYQFIRYRVPLEDSAQFIRLLNQLTNEDLKAKAILDRSKKWFAQDEISRAASNYRRLQGLHLTDMRLFSDIKYFELRLFAAQGQWSMLEETLKKGILFGAYRETEHVYYEAMINKANGNTALAAKNLNWLANNNYYFDEGIVSAATFFQQNGTDNRKSYSILSEALQVNPQSVKILKAYVPAALVRGYDQYAASALQTLKALITPSSFRKYVAENQLSPLLLQ